MKQWLPMKRIVLLYIIFSMLFSFPMSTFAEQSDQEGVEQWQEILELLQEYHVSAPSEEELINASIEGMLESLQDPYTDYFTPEELSSFTSAIEQTYIGVGIRLGETEGTYWIDEIFPGSSALDEGVEAGDIILEVDGQSIEGWELEQVTSAIKGEEGTTVELMLQREGEQLEVVLTRKQVSIPVVYVQRFDEDIAYVQLTSFSASSGEKMQEAISQLEEEGLTSLILDLRDNSGGYLQAARQIAALFIERGILIFTRDQNGEDTPMFIVNGKIPDFDLVVLVNGGSASASEVLSGALQDHQAATLIGSQTFGKGSVQSLFPTSNGGAVKVTVEEYYTPKKHAVNGVGITPDIEVIGDVPQVLTALHVTGAQELNVMLGQEQTQIGDAVFSDVVPVFIDAGQVMVPTRVLSALVGATVSWNGETQSVVMKQGEYTYMWEIQDNQVRLDNGMSYIALSAFQNVFPGFSWEVVDDQVQLTYVKENQ